MTRGHPQRTVAEGLPDLAAFGLNSGVHRGNKNSDFSNTSGTQRKLRRVSENIFPANTFVFR